MNQTNQTDTKDTAAELAYQARHAGKVHVEATPEHVVQRYRETRHWNLFRKEYIFHLIKELAPARVCDFGCGIGETSTELALMGHTVVGFDLSPENIEIARRRAELDKVPDRATFVVADAAESGLGRESFDLILVMAVLHHVDMASGLNSLDYVMKPGGYAIISEPVAFSRLLQWLRDRTPVEKDISPNERQLNQTDLRQIGEKFEIVSVRYFHLFTRLLRVLERRKRVPSGNFFLRFFERTERTDSPVSYLLHRIDSLFLKVPFINHFAGNVVLLCRKRAK